MERYLGIDVRRDSSTVCVLSAKGKQVPPGPGGDQRQGW